MRGAGTGEGGAHVIALVLGPTSADAWEAPAQRRAALVGGGTYAHIRVVDAVPEVVRQAAQLEDQQHPRWAWWAARDPDHPGGGAGRALVSAGVRPARSWDVAQAHQVMSGGAAADPGMAWAFARGLDPAGIPQAPKDDILGALALADIAEAEDVTVPGGYLRGDAVAGTWQVTDARLLSWAQALITTVGAQRRAAQRIGLRVTATIAAESAAAVLCEELEADGLPVDRSVLTELITPLAGDPATRDRVVLRTVPGHAHTDLRNPAQVKEMLHSLGLEVPSTRKHVLELFHDAHPVVPALLEWRKAERIATTYGLRWMAEHIGIDDRLRGRWHANDGGAGRMTAEAGLHNLPAMLRPGVAAQEGWALVRADLGQIEPRVLAAVSGDRAFAQASLADDLYAPVAERLGVDRAVAKVAVLAAMYGQRSGAAGQALEGLERAYPVAMQLLDEAYQCGRRGEPVRTWGGRLIHTRAPGEGDLEPTVVSARGRFARNAVIQGAAAELFKAWAATVRATTAHLGAQIVLCLHDELLVHAPREKAAQVAEQMTVALDAAARRWTGGAPVRFVADLSVVHRWSEAKD